MIKKNVSVDYFETDDILKLPADERDLVRIAEEMTQNAYAPYSAFHVGAAVLLENGMIIKGSNQENGAYPSGLCAERVAAFAASANHPGVSIKKIAIYASSKQLYLSDPVSPCGACRQVLLEYEIAQQSSIKVLLSNESGKILILERIEDLLPLSFSGDGLKKH